MPHAAAQRAFQHIQELRPGNPKRSRFNIEPNQILRLTYRRNFPNNTLKIGDLDTPRGKLFTFRDLWEIDDEGVGKKQNQKTKSR
jgi:hypothetical protein